MNRPPRRFMRGQNTNRRGSSWRRGNQINEGTRMGHNDFGRRRNYDSYEAPPSKRIRRDLPTKRLSEKEVGITEYIGQHQGFTGIIKSRYSDFQVSEINLKGEIAVLTDLSVPQRPSEDNKVEEDDELLDKYNLEVLPLETWDNINKLVSGESDEKVKIDMTGKSKEERTKIHEAVKGAFGPSVVGSTVTHNVDGEERKLVCFDKHRKGVRVDNRVKWLWPGEYVHFLLHKENCDTMEAARIIAAQLRLNIKPSMLGYAGTKDRRAKTTQWLSLRKVDPRRISDACGQLRGIHVGNFSFSANNIKLGMIKGNKFRIALRNTTAPEETISTACEQLKEKGFINYYGLQRFGTRAEMPTYEIGKMLLQNKYKEAMISILELNNEEHLDKVMERYNSFGLSGALKVMGQCNVTLLKKTLPLMIKKDFLSAVNQIPRNTLLLYLHSCQSLLWNNAVSERIRRFGLTPQPGDLVAIDELIDIEISEAELDTTTNDDDNQNEGESQEKEESSLNNEKEDDEIKNNSTAEQTEVRMLTQEDIDSGKYTIEDVVMPMPGFRIEYPSNMIDFFEEELKKDGLDLEMIHKVRSFSLSGTYRRIVARPSDVEWQIVTYNDPYSDLILSDIDHINKRELKTVADGKFKALLLTMTLPSSCYATMALRELLRIETSSDFQASQNDYHKEVKSET